MKNIKLNSDQLKMNLQKFADEIAGLASFGTELHYRPAGTTGETGWLEVAAVKSIPALGTDPEKIDVTHLKSPRKSYIEGIQDTDNLEFAIIYQGANFKDIHTLVETKEAKEWRIKFTDGLTATFTGTVSYKFDGVEVNAALGFNIVVVVSDGPNFTPAP